MNLVFKNIDKDIFWSYLAIFFRLSSGLIILPIAMYKFSVDLVAIWTIFIFFQSLSGVFDFGFKDAFIRNIAYVYSGAVKLEKEGMNSPNTSIKIDYKLLASLIFSMKRFYRYISVFLFILLSTIGTLYLNQILAKTDLDSFYIISCWLVFLSLVTFSLYTLYLDALLLGSGNVGYAKKLETIGTGLSLVLSITLILNDFGLISIIIGQCVSIIIIRYFSIKKYNNDIKPKLKITDSDAEKEIFWTIFSTASRAGLLGIFIYLSQRLTLLIAALFLETELVASYGITFQVTYAAINFAFVYLTAMMPKLAGLIYKLDDIETSRILRISFAVSIIIFLIYAFSIISLGDKFTILIKGNTNFLNGVTLFLFCMYLFLQSFWMRCCGIIVLFNEIPYLKSSMVSLFINTLITIILFINFEPNILFLILTPLVIDLIYNSWKWPHYLSCKVKDMRVNYRE